MNILYTIILTFGVTVNKYALQTTTEGIACTCEGVAFSTVSCTVDESDDFVNIDDYCNNRIHSVELKLLRSANFSSRVIRGNTTKLFRFEITGDNLKYVSENVFFGQEDNLRFVKISGGALDEVPTYSLRHLRRLKSLLLQDNSIRSINCSLRDANLTELMLRGNDISTIHTCAFPTSLHLLSLMNNRIETLNRSLTGHYYLKKLYIQRNSITSLEGELGGLDGLCTLDASWNKIETIGNTSIWLPRLRILNLSKNRITELGSSMNGFINLNSLDLSYNDLNKLTVTSFVNLTELAHLSVSGNGIYSVDNDAFERLTKLEHLLISNNLIKSLDGKLNGLELLEKLDAGNNQIRVIGNAFMGLRSLVELNLAYNHIIHLENSLSALSRLESLDLTFNEIKYISENTIHELKNLRILILAYTMVGSMNGDMFAPLTNLTVLDFSWTLQSLQPLVVPGFMGIMVNSTTLLTDAVNNSDQRVCNCRPRKPMKTLRMENLFCAPELVPLIDILEENGVQLIAC